MKRWKNTVVKYNKADLDKFVAKQAADKVKFEATSEYKTLKANLDLAQKAYNESLEDKKADEKTALNSLETARTEFNDLHKAQTKVHYEDSVIECPELGERVVFVENYREPDVLEMSVIKLEKPFYFDDGKKFIEVTERNYKEFDKTKILKEKTDKYDLEEIIIKK